MRNKAIYKNWIAGDGLERVREWARQGLTDKQIAKNIGVTTVAYYDWRKRFPAFGESIDKARAELRSELEKFMFDLATGKAYVEEIKTILDPSTGTVVRIEKTRKQLPPNANLQTFLAKNLIPEKYHPPCWDSDDVAEMGD
ncbi:MAG: helix-turn-helix domain-containing protein [Selenomonadaceae bacterium]|nr:helix-turn-helix domain-containing protein [Selenomonadaceae bacterium]